MTDRKSIYCQNWKQRLGPPFEGMEEVFNYWLTDHFGFGKCFNSRFLIGREVYADIDQYHNSFVSTLALHKPYDGGDLQFKPDLAIRFVGGPELKLWEWRLSFDNSNFDFDPLEALLNDLFKAKLMMPSNYRHYLYR